MSNFWNTNCLCATFIFYDNFGGNIFVILSLAFSGELRLNVNLSFFACCKIKMWSCAACCRFPFVPQHADWQLVHQRTDQSVCRAFVWHRRRGNVETGMCVIQLQYTCSLAFTRAFRFRKKYSDSIFRNESIFSIRFSTSLPYRLLSFTMIMTCSSKTNQ